ncbi:MAG: ABC-2 type transport system permease protein [Microgenomates group bacterium Gr01-1014_16]|nr:MAG: ABC-2 type transport system permease protein [Microgenomates group bacterium Gr01-1014_16]
MRDMEYRSNFITWMIIDTGWSSLDFLFMLVLINFTHTLGSWSKGEMFIVLGFYRVMVVPVWGWLFQSFSLVPQYISEGKLDLILTKPLDSQFQVSSRQFGFSILPSLVAGIGFILYGFHILGTSPSPLSFLSFLWLTIISTILIYGIYFAIVACSLFVGRLNNIHHVFTSLYDASRYPGSIFSPLLQRILTTIIPISLMVTVPAESLFSSFNLSNIIYFHLAAIGFLVIGRFIWITGLRRYSSASS